MNRRKKIRETAEEKDMKFEKGKKKTARFKRKRQSEKFDIVVTLAAPDGYTDDIIKEHIKVLVIKRITGTGKHLGIFQDNR